MSEQILPKGCSPLLSVQELCAYTVLKLAGSLVNVASINEMWCEKIFRGVHDFKVVMSKDCFKNIRSCLKVYPSYSHDVAIKYPP